MRWIVWTILVLCSFKGGAQTPDTIKVVEFQHLSKSIFCFIDGKLISKKKYEEISAMKDVFSSLKKETYVLFYNKNEKLMYSYLASSPDDNYGEAIFYFKNGKVMAKGEILDNDLIGEWIYYKRNGEVKDVINFVEND